MSLVFEKDLLDRCDTLFMELNHLHMAFYKKAAIIFKRHADCVLET